jgi:hypothetical protein
MDNDPSVKINRDKMSDFEKSINEDLYPNDDEGEPYNDNSIILKNINNEDDENTILKNEFDDNSIILKKGEMENDEISYEFDMGDNENDPSVKIKSDMNNDFEMENIQSGSSTVRIKKKIKLFEEVSVTKESNIMSDEILNGKGIYFNNRCDYTNI